MPTPASLAEEFAKMTKKERLKKGSQVVKIKKLQNSSKKCGNRYYCMNICPIIGC